MKHTLLLFFLACSVCHTAHAQNINRGWHLRDDQTTNLVTLGSTSYYVECTPDDSMNLVAIGTAGERLSKKRLDPNLSWKYAYRLLRTLDNRLLLLWRHGTDCDVRNYTITISKFDTQGTELFRSELPFYTQSNPGNVDITQHSDSSYFIVYDMANQILRYSKTGMALPPLSGFSGFGRISALSTGNLLICGPTAKVISVTGSVVAQQSITAVKQMIERPDGSLLVLKGNGSISAYNASLSSTLASSNLQALPFTTMHLRNDSLFCAGSGCYAVLDPSLAALYQSTLNLPSALPTGITIGNQNRVCIVGTGNTGLNNRSHYSFLQQMPVSGSLTGSQDIGIQSFQVDSKILVPMMMLNDVIVNMTVWVRNYTNQTVNGFYISRPNSNVCERSACLYIPTSIAPQGTVQANFSCRLTYFRDGVPATESICISVTAPNAEVDINPANDMVCQQVNIAVGMEQLDAEGLLLDVYPNPTSEVLNVVGATEGTTVQLLHCNGALLLERKGDKQMSLDLRPFEPGLYFLKASNGQGTKTYKVIKE